jgi:hypothetical protein
VKMEDASYLGARKVCSAAGFSASARRFIQQPGAACLLPACHQPSGPGGSQRAVSRRACRHRRITERIAVIGSLPEWRRSPLRPPRLHASMDPVLAAVESLRAAFPPDAEAPDRHPRRREAALASLVTLASALAAPDAPSLLPLQFEVLFRQLTHLLLVMKAWDASGTAEECLHAVLRCIDALLRSPLVAADAAQLLSGVRLRDLTGQALSELLLAAVAQRSVPLSAACLGAVSLVCRPPASAAGLAPDVLGFFLPGVVSKLAQLCSDDETTRDALRLALLDAMATVLDGTLRDDLNQASLAAADGDEPISAASRLRALHQAHAAGEAGAAVAAATAAAAPAEMSPPHALCVERTAAWLQHTATRLSPVLSLLSGCCLRGGPRARLRLVRLLARLLRESRRCIETCVPVLLDTLCGAMRDPHPPVAAAARAALRRAARRDAPRTAAAAAAPHPSLATHLLAGFERRLGSLPAATRAASSAPLTHALQVLSGELELLGLCGALPSLLGARLPSLLSALLATCRLEVAPAAVEQRLPFRLRGASPLGAAEQIAVCRYSAKPFAFLRDAPSVAAMQASTQDVSNQASTQG